MRRALVVLAVSAALAGCAARPLPPAFVGNEFPKIEADQESRCFEAEREPDAAGGGLRIPRQTVCPTIAPRPE